jgi:hypothetical protein
MMPKMPNPNRTTETRVTRINPVEPRMAGKKIRLSPGGGITTGLVGVDVRVLVALGPAVGGAPLVDVLARVRVTVRVRVGVFVKMTGMKV